QPHNFQARCFEQQQCQIAVATPEIEDAQAPTRVNAVKRWGEQPKRLVGGAPAGQRPTGGRERPAPELVPPCRRLPLSGRHGSRRRAADQAPAPPAPCASFPPRPGSSSASTMVTGPWLTSATSIIAPKRPVSTVTPRWRMKS